MIIKLQQGMQKRLECNTSPNAFKGVIASLGGFDHLGEKLQISQKK